MIFALYDRDPRIAMGQIKKLTLLMCLPGVCSDYMFLCTAVICKYGARPTSARDGIKDALTHVFMASLGTYL